MAMMKKFILAEKIIGEPVESNFSIIEEPIPKVQDNEVKFEAVAISVDPYMRYLAGIREVDTVMPGEQIARVTESRHPDFKVGDLVNAFFGWRTHYVGNPEKVLTPYGTFMKPVKLPDFQGLPTSLGLGMLGMPGNTAYFGLMDLCEPKAGKTLVISGAAGAVGSHVGQIGKIIGCKVIGFAGTDDKVSYLKEELNFDYAFNYKKISVKEALKISAPNGVDYYFDNVGGTMTSDIINSMNLFGRVALCGAISTYNMSEPPLVPAVQWTMIRNQIRMEGFIVSRWAKRWSEGILKNLEWIKEGKLKYKEHITEGFDNTANAFMGMLKGDNTGKAVVIV